MIKISLATGADLSGFKQAARQLIHAGIAPHDVEWCDEDAPRFLSDEFKGEAKPFSIPRLVNDLVTLDVCHSDPERYALLYRFIWRVLHGEKSLLEVPSDPLVHRLYKMSKAIRRDLHKMHAFVRFRSLIDERGDEKLIAWFEPSHFILEATADFFIDRFGSFDWTILTPIGSLHWDRHVLTISAAASKSDALQSDDFESVWQSYYESIFNPARTNIKAMMAEMPKKYWHNMPETKSIAPLIQSAASRVDHMIADLPVEPKARHMPHAVSLKNEPQTLEELNAIISSAEPFVQGGRRAVLGEGPLHPDIAFVGEQPGDQEDLQARPFVGPAGQLFNQALSEAGIDRGSTYVTNAVKHFKFEQRGKRRLHKAPTAGEIAHYRWWLETELGLVQPKLIVALGSTAALALSGKKVAITKVRGPIDFPSGKGFVTVHPSYLLRIPDEMERRQAYAAFCADLRSIRAMASHLDEKAALLDQAV